jgi:HEAT repeat protein
MIPAPRRFYRPDGGDRVAEVAAQPAADRVAYVVAVSRGPHADELRETALHGPYAEDDLPGAVAAATDELRAEGFLPAGVPSLLQALDDPNPAVRGRAPLRLGWRRSAEAVEKLLALLQGSVDETCSVLDALGAIGDPRAVPALRDYAGRKLLSRRRSAVEALRRLGDEEGLQEARQRARGRLPEPVVAALDAPGATAAQVAQAILGFDLPAQGTTLDTLYEVADPVPVAAVRQVLSQANFAQPHVWRNAKSVFKRALLRHDYQTLGELTHAIEMQGRVSKGAIATVKSGHDGQLRATVLFGKKTQDYLRRLAWRYLCDLARYRPEDYAPAAAEALIPYRPEDFAAAGLGRCYLLHRILWGWGNRFTFDGRSMTFRLRSRNAAQAPAGVREEAFPELWDARPRAYLRLAAAALLPEAQAFAVRGLEAHPDVLTSASAAEVISLLQAPYESTVQLGLHELDRRFDPERPDWSLLLQLLADDRLRARLIGQRWLRLTAHRWLRDPDLILGFVASPNANLRALVVEMAAGALRDDPALRQEVARRLAELFRTPEGVPGAHEGPAQLARDVLSEELGALVSVAELAAWIARGSPALKALAGHLLRRRPDAVDELGLERLAALAQHEVAAVRAAAHALLRAAADRLRADPSALFLLAESDWEDTRREALDLLRTRIDVAALGLDGVTGLLDSNRPEVQEAGRDLVVRHVSDLPMGELAARLAQHPDPAMRRFALDVVTKHLPPGEAALAPLKGFCRAALLDLRPDRKVKRQVIDFLTARGLEGSAQAEVAAAVLGDIVRLQGRADFENALEALVRLKLAYPDLQTTVRLPAGGGP